MMKKHLFFIICLFFAVELFSLERVTFAIGNWEPYTSERYVQYQILEQLVREIFEAEGVEVAFRYSPWKRSYEEVKSGTSDATFPWIYTEERENEFLFSNQIIMREDTVFFHHRDLDFQWASLDDLEGLRIGGTLGYAYAEELEEYGLTVDWVNDEILNFRKLLYGRIDLYPATERVGNFLIQKFFGNQASEFVFNRKPLRRSPYYMLISKNIDNGGEIKSIFDEGLLKLIENGRYDEIFSQSRN